MPIENHSEILSIIFLLLIAAALSIVCLVVLLLINKNWKTYHIDAIEFKTKYYPNKADEQLLYTSDDPSLDIDVDGSVRDCHDNTMQEQKEGRTTKTELVTEKKDANKIKSKRKNKEIDNVGLLDHCEEDFDFSIQLHENQKF